MYHNTCVKMSMQTEAKAMEKKISRGSCSFNANFTSRHCNKARIVNEV